MIKYVLYENEIQDTVQNQDILHWGPLGPQHLAFGPLGLLDFRFRALTHNLAICFSICMYMNGAVSPKHKMERGGEEGLRNQNVGLDGWGKKYKKLKSLG